MGLSVGVVSIEYLEEPQPPVLDFLKDLAMDPSIGTDDDDGGYWGGGWGENTFLEFELSELETGAELWCDDKDLEDNDRAAVTEWVAALPARDGYVMPHLGV